jgi:hypothetical protein
MDLNWLARAWLELADQLLHRADRSAGLLALHMRRTGCSLRRQAGRLISQVVVWR